MLITLIAIAVFMTTIFIALDIITDDITKDDDEEGD